MSVPVSLIVLAVILLSYIASVESVTGEIVSCPGCKLNKLPEVRKFFKVAGQADSYNDLKITFIQGRNPDLLVKDDAGNLLERIDLSRMSNADIHSLMAAKGFTRKEGAPAITEDLGIQPASVTAQAVAASDISKVGSLSSGLPIQRVEGLRAGAGGRLRKRQESLMKAMAQVEQQSTTDSNAAAATLRI